MNSMLVAGPEPRPTNWDAAWRGELVSNLEILVHQLWDAGVTDIFVNGSFVTRKDHPNDIDGYFLCSFWDVALGTLEQRLNQLDPNTWSMDIAEWELDPRKRRKPPTWFRYHVELYWDFTDRPSFAPPILMGEQKTVHQFFRETRENQPRGIVRIVP